VEIDKSSYSDSLARSQRLFSCVSAGLDRNLFLLWCLICFCCDVFWDCRPTRHPCLTRPLSIWSNCSSKCRWANRTRPHGVDASFWYKTLT
jgi:hypothetical protein